MNELEDYSFKLATHLLMRNNPHHNLIGRFADRIRDYFTSLYCHKTSTNQPIPVPKIQQIFFKTVMNQVKKCGFTSNQLIKVNNSLFKILFIAFDQTFQRRSRLIIDRLCRSKQIEENQLMTKETNRLDSIKSYLKQYYHNKLGEIDCKIVDIDDIEITEYNLKYDNLPPIRLILFL